MTDRARHSAHGRCGARLVLVLAVTFGVGLLGPAPAAPQSPPPPCPEEECPREEPPPDDPDPTLDIEPPQGLAGWTVTARGEHWDDDLALELRFDGTIAGGLDAEGADWITASTFATDVVVPPRAPGDYLVRACQPGCNAPASGLQATTTFTVLPPPTLTLDPDRGLVGHDTDASGTGWDSALSLRLLFDGEPVGRIPAGDPAFDTHTTFAVTLVVPDRPPGTYEVTACQDCGGLRERSATAPYQVDPAPTLTLDPDRGAPGDITVASGTNWTRDEPLRLFFAGTLIETVPAGGAAFTSQTTFRLDDVVVPDLPPGTHPVEACQRCGTSRELRAVADFVIGVTLTVTPDRGPAGSTTAALGTGFRRDQDAELFFDGDHLRTVVAESDDWESANTFRASLVVPDRPPGPYTVFACQRCGTATEIGASDIFTITSDGAGGVGPTLAVDPDRGPPESTTTASGTGWDPDLALELSLDGERVAIVRAGSGAFDGSAFATEITVPDLPGGPVVARACQRCGQAGEVVATALFTVIPALELEHALGRPGFVTAAIGRGFPAGADVELVWQPGIGRVRLVAGSDGRFRVGMLVLRRDILGPRVARATLPGQAVLPEEERLPEPEAPFLVVPGSLQPGSFVIRR